MRKDWWLSLLAVSVLAGCGVPVVEQARTEQTETDTATVTSEPADAADDAADSTDAPDETSDRVVADVGVGEKGRSLEGDDVVQVIARPAAEYFRAKERIVFQIQVPNAIRTHEALEGSLPQTHDEFMEKIIQANGITLPPLPPGRKYVWDPEQKQLMVESE